jgi:hypothetical protein
MDSHFCSPAVPALALAADAVSERVYTLKAALTKAAQTDGKGNGGDERLYTRKETRPLVESHLLSLCKLAVSANHFHVMALYYLARMYAAFEADGAQPKRATYLVNAAVRSLRDSATTHDGQQMQDKLLSWIKNYHAHPFSIINDEAAAKAGAPGGSVEKYWMRVLQPASVNTSKAKKFQLWARFHELGNSDFITAMPDAAQRAVAYEEVVRGETDPSALIGVRHVLRAPAAGAADAAAEAGGGVDPATEHVNGPLSFTRRFSQFSMLTSHLQRRCDGLITTHRLCCLSVLVHCRRRC